MNSTIVRHIQSQSFTNTEDLRKEVREVFLNNTKYSAEKMRDIVLTCFTLGMTAGWWHDLKTGEPLNDRSFGDIAALIHSEISEAFEFHRKGNKNDDHLPQYPGKVVELVDAVVRIFDYVGSNEEMMEQFIQAMGDKLLYNANRADHKVENRLADGGKKL